MDGRFFLIMREESCQNKKNCMLDYLIALLDDSNNFSWQAAKTSHTVLLCRMEQLGEVTSWSDTKKIDWIRCPNAQRHVVPSQISNYCPKFRKKIKHPKSATSQCHLFITMITHATSQNKTNVVFCRNICSSCFAQDGKTSAPSAQDCKSKHLKIINSGHGH